MKKSLTVLVLTLMSFPIYAETEIKGNPQDLRQFLHPNDTVVTIYGEADEKAYSDKAIVSLVITTEDKMLAASIEANGKLRQLVTQQLVKSGIPADNIKSSKFSTSPQYGWFGKKPDSYKVMNRMAISITDEKHLKDIASIADTHKEIELSDTSFEHTKKDQFKEKVKLEALSKVMKEKNLYERNLGIKLVPTAFRDSRVVFAPTRGAEMLEEVVVTGFRASGGSTLSKRSRPESPEASFDEINYKASISVDFKILK